MNCAIHCNSSFCRFFYVAFLRSYCIVNRDSCVLTQQRYGILRSYSSVNCHVILRRCADVACLGSNCRIDVNQSIFTVQIYVTKCLHCALDVNRFFSVTDTDIAARRRYRIVDIDFAFVTTDSDIADSIYLALLCGCAYADPYTAFSRSQRYFLTGFYIATYDNRVNKFIAVTIGRCSSFLHMNRCIAIGCFHDIANFNQAFSRGHRDITNARRYLSVYSNPASISFQFNILISLNCAIHCNSGFCRCFYVACLGCYCIVNRYGCVLAQQRYIRSGLNRCTCRYCFFRRYFYFTSYGLYRTIQSYTTSSSINLHFPVCGCGTAKNNIPVGCTYGDCSACCSCRQCAYRIGFNLAICGLNRYILTINLIIDVDVATGHGVQAYCFLRS